MRSTAGLPMALPSPSTSPCTITRVPPYTVPSQPCFVARNSILLRFFAAFYACPIPHPPCTHTHAHTHTPLSPRLATLRRTYHRRCRPPAAGGGEQVRGDAPLILDRADGFIGVMIDDLTTQGTLEYSNFANIWETIPHSVIRHLPPLACRVACSTCDLACAHACQMPSCACTPMSCSIHSCMHACSIQAVPDVHLAGRVPSHAARRQR